jgi:hypothetical protein
MTDKAIAVGRYQIVEPDSLDRTFADSILHSGASECPNKSIFGATTYRRSYSLSTLSSIRTELRGMLRPRDECSPHAEAFEDHRETFPFRERLVLVWQSEMMMPSVSEPTP